MKVAMLLSNPFRPDPRVFKEAMSLSKAGNHVSIICWDREVEYQLREENRGIDIIRVQSVKSSYGAGTKQLLSVPRFWRAALNHLEGLHPDVLHCHDLDTLPIGWYYLKKHSCKIIFDAHEDYPSLMSLYLPKFLVASLAQLESFLIRDIDRIITASTMLAKKYNREGKHKAIAIGNYPPLAEFENLALEDVITVRKQLNIDESKLLVAYIGGFSRNRMLNYLIDAARRLPDIQFAFWGDGHQRMLIQSASDSLSNVDYFGWLPNEQVPLYTSAADIFYYCIDPDYPGARFNAPNALGNAMAAGTPLIANDLGDLGYIIKATKAGILLERLSTDAIIDAIQLYRDPLIREQHKMNGKQAARSIYNWERMECKLIGMYNELSQN